ADAALPELVPHLVDERLERAALDGRIEIPKAEVEQALVSERAPAAPPLRHATFSGMRCGPRLTPAREAAEHARPPARRVPAVPARTGHGRERPGILHAREKR